MGAKCNMWKISPSTELGIESIPRNSKSYTLPRNIKAIFNGNAVQPIVLFTCVKENVSESRKCVRSRVCLRMLHMLKDTLVIWQWKHVYQKSVVKDT